MEHEVDRVGVGVRIGFVACDVRLKRLHRIVVFQKAFDVLRIVELSLSQAKDLIEISECSRVKVLGGNVLYAVLLAGDDGDVVGDCVCGIIEDGIGLDDDIHVTLPAV